MTDETLATISLVEYLDLQAALSAAEQRAETAEALIKALASSVAGLVQIGIDREQVTTLAQRQLSEALAREAGKDEALNEARAFIAGTDDGDREYALARIDQALSATGPSPYAEVVRAAQEETQAEIDEPTLSRTRRSGEAARIVWKARQKRRAAVSALLTSAYPSDTAALIEAGPCKRCESTGVIHCERSYHGERSEIWDEQCPDCKGSGKASAAIIEKEKP